MKSKTAGRNIKIETTPLLGRRLSLVPVVAEAPPAHVVGDKAEQAYRRSDALEKRRRLMDAWARYCQQKPAEKVVKLRR